MRDSLAGIAAQATSETAMLDTIARMKMALPKRVRESRE